MCTSGAVGGRRTSWTQQQSTHEVYLRLLKVLADLQLLASITQCAADEDAKGMADERVGGTPQRN